MSQIHRDPSVTVTVDLVTQEITFPDGSTEGFEMDPFARNCMLNGLDPMDHLLNQLQDIERYEAQTPARVRVTSPCAGPEAS